MKASHKESNVLIAYQSLKAVRPSVQSDIESVMQPRRQPVWSVELGSPASSRTADEMDPRTLQATRLVLSLFQRLPLINLPSLQLVIVVLKQ